MKTVDRKVRHSLDLDSSHERMLLDLQKRLGVTSKADLLRMALNDYYERRMPIERNPDERERTGRTAR